jgi:hypothetical protein
MPPPDQPNLYPSTSQIAGAQAARKSGSWRVRILDRLRERPSTLWEVAEHYGVPDHTISGRFSELARDLWIEHTGERRPKPGSGCPAEVWRVRGDAPAPGTPDELERLGYPVTLRIGSELHDRQALLGGGEHESWPGIPYARRADAGGVRLTVRVVLFECPGCGGPLFLVEDRDKATPGKLYRCGRSTCGQTWRPVLVQESGRGQVIAMVMERH